MNGAWATVFDIARRRDQTKQGKDTLSKHEIEVLMGFVTDEARSAMATAMGFSGMTIVRQ